MLHLYGPSRFSTAGGLRATCPLATTFLSWKCARRRAEHGAEEPSGSGERTAGRSARNSAAEPLQSSFFQLLQEHLGLSSIRVAPIEHPFRGVLREPRIGTRSSFAPDVSVSEQVRRIEVGAQLEAQRLEKVKGEKSMSCPPVDQSCLQSCGRSLSHVVYLC